MRSLTVADILAADFILAPLQLFSAEGYQRHFDALAKPGLDLWCSPADDDVTPPVEAPRENPPAEPLRCGEMVQLHGLERVELNGCKGRLLEWQGATGRWSCLLTEKKKRKDSKKLLVNVKPCNVKALKQRGEGKRPLFRKARRSPAQAKASKYYGELRAREDYMARRQVDLERHLMRLLQQAAKESPREMSMNLANSGATLEMFRFNRLVLDDGHLLVRDLVNVINGGSFNNLQQYLVKVAPLYAVHAITANSRWCLADLECLKAGNEVAPFASLLGLQIPWGDASEAQRFLDSWAAALEDTDRVLGSHPLQVDRPLGVEKIVHELQFSRKERVVYLFRFLERQADPDFQKRQRMEHVRTLLQLCCEPTDLEELVKDVLAQKCLKEADVTLAEDDYSDFELRLQAFKTLAERDTEGYEREVLLACGHSNAEELQSLLRHGVSVGEPLEVQLRHLAQVALEGRDSEPSRVHEVECQACDRLTRPKEVVNTLRLAQQRAHKAHEKATRRWRLLQVLLEAAGLPSHDTASQASPLALCHCGASKTRLMACGHVACEGHETCNCDAKEVAVTLDFQKCQESKELSPCTKIDAMVCAIQKIVAENPKVQCLVFSQWTSTLRKLDEALRAQNLDPFLTGRRGKAATKKIILMTPDFLYSERPRSQEQGQKFALESNTTIRHVFLANTFLAPVKDAVLEQRIIDFAKTNQLGVASTVVLHRFVMSDTIEANNELQETI